MVGAAGTLRWFYSDPLAAAWQAKHFGMRFKDSAGYSVSANPAMLDCSERHGMAQALFLHPSDVELLAPQQGDLTRLHWLDGSVSTREWEAEDELPTAALDRDVRVQPIVIQRQGIPFMWPQREP